MANSAFSDATHAANRHSDIAITSVASNDILKFDGTNWVNSTTSPDSSIAVTQSSHGFIVGNVLKSSGSNGAYAKAQANNAANAEVVGIVTVRTDANNFILTLNGMIRVAAAVPDETAGTALFLHEDAGSDEGTLTATEPSTAGEISKPVAIVTTANAEMVLISHRGETISTGVTNWDVNGLELVLDADGDTSLTADTDDQIDVKISGADDFRFTANKLDVLSGSTLEINGTLDINGTELILDANGNTSITADTDDQIDIKISGADDFRFTANSFNILSGSTITIDSGATITNSGTANGFGGNAFTNDVTITSGNVVMATAGKGIDFSANTDDEIGTGSLSSELLDDYEEGTWTPRMEGSTGTIGSGASAQVGGTYTKVGRLVTVRGGLYNSNLGSWTGQLRVLGLPFTCLNGYHPAAIGRYPSTIVDAVWRTAQFNGGQTYLDFGSGSGVDTRALYSEISANHYMTIAGFYYV